MLHAVWGGPTHRGIRTFAELQELGPDLRVFVEEHVQRVLAEELPLAAREQMQPRYLELEEKRLVRLVTEWLEYERTRVPFTVDATEEDANPTIAGLTLKLRLDRLDRLNDGSLLVIDYKSGNVSPTSRGSCRVPMMCSCRCTRASRWIAKRDRRAGVCQGPHRRDLSSRARCATPGHPRRNLNRTSGLVKNPLTPADSPNGGGPSSNWRAISLPAAPTLIRATIRRPVIGAACIRCAACKNATTNREPEDEENGAEAADE